MPEAVEIRGKFVNEEGVPLKGRIKFIPSMIWVEEDDDVWYPALAPEAVLKRGQFKIYVTRTDQLKEDWFYTVISPIGSWTVHAEGEGPLQLKNLLPNRFA